MPLGLPSSPTLGQQWPVVSPVWEYDGTKWVAIAGTGGAATPVTDRLASIVGTDDFIGLRAGAPYLVAASVIADYTGGAPADTAPAAFTAGQWTAAATAVAGEISFNLTALPADGGSPITALEYRVGAGAAIAFVGTGTGVRVVTAGLTAGVAVDLQVRAVNAIGASAWSDIKNRTPLAGGGGGLAVYQAFARTEGNLRQTVGIDAAKPAATASTDLLVAFLDSNEQLKIEDISPPAGWTLRAGVFSDFSSATGTRVWTAAGDVSDMLFRMATNDAWTGGAVYVVRVSGVNLADPVRQIATRAAQTWTPEVANMPTPTVTAGEGDCVLSGYVQVQSTTAVGTPTAGYTRVIDQETPNRVSVVHQSDIAAGATGEISHGAGAVAFEGRIGFTLALRAV